MKKRYFLLLFFIILISGILLYIGLFQQEQLIGIGSTYVLDVEQADGSIWKYSFQTTRDYYIQEGCVAADGSNINGCNIQVIQNSTLGGCPVNQVISTGGWRDCSTGSSKDRCMYGGNCNPSDRICKNYCDWEAKDYGLKGGIDYGSVDGCAWSVKVTTENGTLLKEWSKVTEIDGWRTDRPFTDKQVNDNDYRVTFPTAITEDSTDCYTLKGAVRGDRYRYKFCLGNDWTVGDTTHCTQEDVLRKECVLTCPYDKLLNETECTCYSKPPQCMIDNDCNNSSMQCFEEKCVPVPKSESPPIILWIGIGTLLIIILTVFIMIKRK